MKKIFLTSMLVIGIIIEGSNLQSLFFAFSQQVRPDWYMIINQAVAAFFALFFLCGIVGFGLANDKKASWGLAILTMIVSLLAYRNIATFSIENPEITQTKFVVLLISIAVPFLVAYCTHQLAPYYADTIEVMTLEERIKVNAMQQAAEKLSLNSTPTLQLADKPQHIKDIAKDLLAELERVKEEQQRTAKQPIHTPPPSEPRQDDDIVGLNLGK